MPIITLKDLEKRDAENGTNCNYNGNGTCTLVKEKPVTKVDKDTQTLHLEEEHEKTGYASGRRTCFQRFLYALIDR